MLVASIREKRNNYYVYLEKKDNEYEWQVVCANNSKTYTLEEEEAKSIINKMFDSNLTYLRKEKDYTIYLDEANNKRYFKNNKEDFIRFFLKNGEEAILFNENEREEKRITNLLNHAKGFIIKKQDNIVSYYSIFLLFLLFTSSVVKEVKNPKTMIMIEMLCKYNPKIEKDLNSSSLSYNDIINYINHSNDKLLTNDKRKYLTNINLFNDVLEVSDLSRCYILRKRLNNIGIRYFTEEYKNNHLDLNGYYNHINYPNLIHLRDDSDSILRNAAPHELIHLLQDSNQYRYIREASAEILMDEYYGSPAKAYRNTRRRVYILMEMIGPQPIFECNFKGDTSTFEDKIHEVLEENDANRLLELFTKSPAHDKEPKKTNQEIDELLAKMYQNIYGRDISSDKFIQHIYKEDSLERYYFNTSSRKYNEDYQYFDKEELDYDSVMQSDTLKFVNKQSILITKDEFLKEIKKKILI